MKLIITYILIACTFSAATAQDINFSQFYELPMLRNPALAGSYQGDFRATTAYRQQWASVTTPYTTQALGVEMKFTTREESANYFSLGVQLTNDVAGDSKMGKTQVLPVVAFHKSLGEDNDTYLSLGFMGGVVQNKFDPQKLTFNDQFVNGSYDPTNPTRQTFNVTNLTYFDGGVGLVFSNSAAETVKYYVGASLFHFNKPKVSFFKESGIVLDKKLMINGGVSGKFGDNNTLILYADYFTQGGSSQMQGGFMYKHDLINEDETNTVSISAGSFLRWSDAVIPIIKLDYYHLGIGITYDANISKLTAASRLRGGFEATLSYRNFLNFRNTSLDKTKCPGIF